MIGYLYADGYIYKDNRTVELHTSTKDLSNHRNFITVLEPKRVNIKFCNNNTIKTIAKDNDLSKLLQSYRIINRKTYKGNFPIIVGFERDLIRGYLDGDGYIGDYSIEFCAKRKKTLSQFNEYYLRPIGIKNSILRHNRGYYRLQIYKDRYKLLDYIYYDGCLCLERKRRIYDKRKSA